MPRIPNRQIPDEWESYEDDFEYDDEDRRERKDRKRTSEDEDWKQKRRDEWRKSHRSGR